MLVQANPHIPGLAKGIKALRKKKQHPIASTATGDEVYYMPLSVGKGYGKIKDELDDSDTSDESDDDDFDDPLSKSVKSYTGANWRPNFNDRMTVFIAGAPGAGKSYLAKELINLLPRDTDILLFTALEEKDGNFDELGKDRLFKIKMTPEVLKNISLSEIRQRSRSPQTILLFDDVDKIRDPKVQAATFAVMNDALANGRGHEKHDGSGDIHVICTSHSLNDYQKTKYTFENSNYAAFFPGTTPALQMYRIFDKMGLDKELCKKMMKMGRAQKIRSIIIHKVVPMYMIYGDKIKLL